MADMITDASTNGPAASSSATHMQPVARWNVLLGYLKAAGLCEQQLRDVQDILIDISFARWDVLLGYLKAAGLCEQQLRDVQEFLIDISFQDIDISIWRMDGEKLDLTISGYLTAAGLRKRIASEWAIQASSLQLAIGSTCLRDSDVIAEFVSSTDRVVTAVVSAPRALQDRDQSTEVNDKIRVKLENVAPHMDEGQHQHLMTLWEQSCQGAQESCEAAASALARLSNGLVQIQMGDRTAKETVKDARREILNAIVKRVEGWQVGNTLDSDKIRCVFERLASEAGCEDNTVWQLLNCARALKKNDTNNKLAEEFADQLD